MTQSTPKSSRFVAIATLHDLSKTSQPFAIIFNRLAKKNNLQGNDRHLAMNLVYGVLRQRYYLDALMGKLCRQPLRKLHPFIHQALAVGLYQIFFLDRIPDSAAVNESIKAIKAAHLPKKLQGFANGVLRESVRQKDILPAPGNATLKSKALLNHPQWMTERWQKRFGKKEMERVCVSNNQQPPLVLRINTLKIDRDSFMELLAQKTSILPGNYAPEAVLLPGYQGPINEIPGYSEGYFQVQDEAAQLVTPLLAPFFKDSTYLDGCAGLGGKTSHLLQLTQNCNSIITAVEPEERRFSKLQENINRLYPHDTQKNVTSIQEDLQGFTKKHRSLFDGILLDAPCSGTGVIGRHPDIRWNRREKDLSNYRKKQLALLDNAALLLHPGGVLVYVTCSLESEENEEVVEKFLSRHKQFSLTECAPYLPEAARLFVKDKLFSSKPSGTIDGFFAARLVHK